MAILPALERRYTLCVCSIFVAEMLMSRRKEAAALQDSQGAYLRLFHPGGTNEGFRAMALRAHQVPEEYSAMDVFWGPMRSRAGSAGFGVLTFSFRLSALMQLANSDMPSEVTSMRSIQA